MIQLDNVDFERDGRPLISHGSLTVYPGQKVGLIGSNGSGKSTLFELFLGRLDPSSGEYRIPKNWVFAHMAQTIPHTDQAAIEFVIDGDTTYRQLNADLGVALTNNNSDAISHLTHELETIDAYRIPAKAGQLLSGLGFSQEEHNKPVNAFSGGWRVRLKLAQALISRCDCLLLDEPTNHLDIEAIVWLEKWLKNYPGTLIVIAHDSLFLDGVVDTIIAIDNKQFQTYSGNYSQYLKQRAEQLSQQQKMHEKQLKQAAHLKKFIDRFKAKASKAKQAQSRIKQLNRLEQVGAVHINSPFHFEFKPLDRSPNPLLKLEQVAIGYDAVPILENINFNLSPLDRVGIVGANGAGKSTFIKCLAGNLSPISGIVTRADQLRLGYFSQHQVEELDRDSNALQHLQVLSTKSTEQTLRTYLGSFGFSGDQVYQKVGTLSGGEAARLTLALIVWQEPHLLLLDEPTNHLDIEMREALGLALQTFEGAMVLISHDRQLMAETTQELFLCANGTVKPFDGDIFDYCLMLKKQPTKKGRKNEGPQTQVTKKKPLDSKTQRHLQNKLKSLEARMEILSNELADIKKKLGDPKFYRPENKEALSELQNSLEQKEAQLVNYETEWFALSTEIS